MASRRLIKNAAIKGAPTELSTKESALDIAKVKTCSHEICTSQASKRGLHWHGAKQNRNAVLITIDGSASTEEYVKEQFDLQP